MTTYSPYQKACVWHAGGNMEATLVGQIKF